MAPDIFAGAYHLAERQNPYLLDCEGVAKCTKGIRNAHFSKGQKLRHSPAREEKQTEQETPPHYTR